MEIGQETNIDFNLKQALSAAVVQATELIPLRKHTVDPLTRQNSNEPLFDIVCDVADGNQISVAILIKGAGSENMSSLRMLNPLQDIRSFILETIWDNGGKPCPPIIIGIGIGGTFDGCARLAKKALLRSLNEREDAFETELLQMINRLGIGPMGLGGDTTALRVFIQKSPCHTAMLPVALAVQCWADRKAKFSMKF